MRLACGEIRPGKVLQVIDEFGTIKASCAGMFSEEDDPEMLPPVYPFMQSSASNFNQPRENDLIWVMSFSDNTQELFYIFQGNTKSASTHILSKKPKDAQILTSKQTGLGTSNLYFSTEDGWMMNSNDSRMQIDKDKNITLSKDDMSNRSISISEDGISLGTEGKSAQPAVLGNALENCLDELHNTLYALAQSMKANPYTSPAGEVLEAKLPGFSSLIGKIKSQNVTLD